MQKKFKIFSGVSSLTIAETKSALQGCHLLDKAGGGGGGG